MGPVDIGRFHELDVDESDPFCADPYGPDGMPARPAGLNRPVRRTRTRGGRSCAARRRAAGRGIVAPQTDLGRPPLLIAAPVVVAGGAAVGFDGRAGTVRITSNDQEEQVGR